MGAAASGFLVQRGLCEDVIDQPKSVRFRRRGTVLSAQGWQRLQAAEHLSSIRENAGRPYTLEQLSLRTGLSTKTLTKVRHRQKPVDQPTLEAYFEAFELALGADDYISQDLSDVEVSSVALSSLQEAPLKGQLAVDSPFYVYRAPAERLCVREVFQLGALIRIKAPRQFGKTSLAARIVSQSQESGFRTAMISLEMADQGVFSSLDQFLRWLCAMVTRYLEMPNRLQDYWSDLFGSSYSCNDYFESYILPADGRPLLLVIDEVDRVFDHEAIAADFFGMLRSWYERSRYGTAGSELWQQLRLVIVHSTEAYLPIKLNQSPFNVGLLIELSGFSEAQIQELANRYGLTPSEEYTQALMALLGGNPYLTQLALFHLSRQTVSLADLPKTAIAPQGIFNGHLRRLLGFLEEQPGLKTAMQRVVQSPEGAEIYPTDAVKLQGMGLVRFQGSAAVAACKLYQMYFAHVLDLGAE
ncbi:AAA-like domain-containing protein [Geitlerinema sp. PCC 7407]|uniref:AAA-like domain-containing protein n=1 Tax=Geitlerinema sp. PCC 7407 TaxID=1173025 RepID=UPI00029FBC2A|nr:AAA-like domain-containing protein [Geitlerinema sp. PCC 7407]AFY64594.1 hypothetical protein GEI7407_0089 [Geitlerinema sp. PCC 7407]